MPRTTQSIHCKSGPSLACGASDLWKIDLKSVGPSEFAKILSSGGKKSKVPRTVGGKKKLVVVLSPPCGRCRIAVNAKDKDDAKASSKSNGKSKTKG